MQFALVLDSVDVGFEDRAFVREIERRLQFSQRRMQPHRHVGELLHRHRERVQRRRFLDLGQNAGAPRNFFPQFRHVDGALHEGQRNPVDGQ